MTEGERQGLQPHELAGHAGDGQVRAEGQDAEFAVGRDATHAYAVHYQGAWETPWDGTCTAVRRHACALASTGLPVLLESFHRVLINEQGFAEPAQGNIQDAVLDEVGHLVDVSASALVPRIKHLVVRDEAHLRQVLMPRWVATDTIADADALLAIRQHMYETSIVFSVWERDRVDRGIARQLGRCAQAWVPCRQNGEMLCASGVPEHKVRVVPHPFDPASDVCKLIRRRPLGTRRFYAISGTWQPRKGFEKLLGAFLRAFRPEDDAHLVLKYSGGDWEDYIAPRACLKLWLDDATVKQNGWTMAALAGKLEMVEGRTGRDQIVRLHFENNIYVSPSHGEAWCLPAFDAKCAGNRLVHVPYGGTDDFDDPTDVRVPFRMAPAHPSYRWGDGAQWADCEVDELAACLRRVEPPAAYGHSQSFVEGFSAAAVGRKMRALVLEVAQAVPEARKFLAGVSA